MVVVHKLVQIQGKDSHVQEKQYTKQYKNAKYTKQKTNLKKQENKHEKNIKKYKPSN